MLSHPKSYIWFSFIETAHATFTTKVKSALTRDRLMRCKNCWCYVPFTVAGVFPVRQHAQRKELETRDLNGMRPWLVSADYFHLIWYNVCFPETQFAVGKLPVVNRTNGPDVESVGSKVLQEKNTFAFTWYRFCLRRHCLGLSLFRLVLWAHMDAKWFHLCWPRSHVSWWAS